MNQSILLFASVLASVMQRSDKLVISFLKEQNKVLLEVIGGKDLNLTDAQRMRLAELGRPLGWSVLQEVCMVVHPVTLYRWYRQLICEKYTAKFGSRRRNRMKEIKKLVIRIAQENSIWGYGKIQGAMQHLGFKVCRTTIAKILKDAGFDPAPRKHKGMDWGMFINAHLSAICATDFFTVEVLTRHGLVRYFVHFVIELDTRKAEITRIAPDGHWRERNMLQIARHLLDAFSGMLNGRRYLIMDNDVLYTKKFKAMLQVHGVIPKCIPVREPMYNGYAEAFVRQLRRECLSYFIFMGEGMLRRVLAEYMTYYNSERPHQGIENKLIEPDAEVFKNKGSIACRERLGGVLKYYHREAA